MLLVVHRHHSVAADIMGRVREEDAGFTGQLVERVVHVLIITQLLLWRHALLVPHRTLVMI